MTKVTYEVSWGDDNFRVSVGDVLLGWVRLERKYSTGKEEWLCEFPPLGSSGLFKSRDDAVRRLIAEHLDRQKRTSIPEDTEP